MVVLLGRLKASEVLTSLLLVSASKFGGLWINSEYLASRHAKGRIMYSMSKFSRLSSCAVSNLLIFVVSMSDETHSDRFYKGEVLHYDAKKKKHKVRQALSNFMSLRMFCDLSFMTLISSIQSWGTLYIFKFTPTSWSLDLPLTSGALSLDLVSRWGRRNSQPGERTVGVDWQTRQDLCEEGEGRNWTLKFFIRE